MSITKPRTASGFVEYLPQEQIEFNRLLDIIKSTYEKYGFSPLDTPDLELKEVLLTKGGGETDKQVYELTRGRNDFCLRFDLTVPLARYVAGHQNDLVFPFRRYHIGKVHRAERAQAGRFREFYQCDIDVIGSNSPVVDAELPVIINDIFSKFSFGDFTIHINDRRLLNGFFSSIGIRDTKTEVMRIIDKLEKLPLSEIKSQLQELDLDQNTIDKLLAFISMTGDNDSIFQQLDNLKIKDKSFISGLNNLKTIIGTIRLYDIPETRFQIDLKIARGLDYYTGTVYETTLNDYPELGSICSGGRYDDLASHYSKVKLPGVGISIGLTRLFSKLQQAGIIDPVRKSPANIAIFPLSNGELDLAIQAADKLRQINMPNLLYSEDDSIKKKLRYADKMGFKYAIILGDKEARDKTVTIKNMIDGNSDTISIADLKSYFN